MAPEKVVSCTIRRIIAAFSLPALVACGGGGGVGGSGNGGPPVLPGSAQFFVDTSWTANSDNPDGYLIYAGASAGNATTLVKTLAKGAPDWNPASPSAQLTSNDVVAAIGSAAQICVAVRAYNTGGVSPPSATTCTALP